MHPFSTVADAPIWTSCATMDCLTTAFSEIITLSNRYAPSIVTFDSKSNVNKDIQRNCQENPSFVPMLQFLPITEFTILEFAPITVFPPIIDFPLIVAELFKDKYSTSFGRHFFLKKKDYPLSVTFLPL